MTKAKRMLSLLLAVIMILSVIPITAGAAEHDSDPSDGPSTGVNGLYMNKTVNSVAQMATPLALITIGAGFEGRKALAKIRPTIAASMIKLVIQPLIFLPVAAWMGFHGEQMIAILIMLASPTTPSCYIMAKNMDNDGVLTASVIVMTTLLAAFTLTGWIFILKTVGLIG